MSVFSWTGRRAVSATQDAGEGVRSGRKRDVPLVPAASIEGRSLVTVIAIMAFLAGLAAGAAFLISEASQVWRGAISREMTIQVRPIVGRDLDADTATAVAIARATPGVAGANAYSKDESERLLQPWLGEGLDLSDLPVPRLIVVQLDRKTDLDTPALRNALAEKLPNAAVDDHRLWLERLGTMASTVVGAAIVIFVLVMAAMMLAVAFATRGAMASNNEIIEVLHFVGAADTYISRQFQTRFFRLGLRGGAIGGGGAILAFLTLAGLSRWWRSTAGGDQIDALFGSFDMPTIGYLAIAVIAAAIAVITGHVSRVIVFRHLRRLT